MARIAGFKNVKHTVIGGRKYVMAYITHQGKYYSKCFNTPEEAARWVDKLCLQFNIKQKNNTFTQIK